MFAQAGKKKDLRSQWNAGLVISGKTRGNAPPMLLVLPHSIRCADYSPL